MTQPNKDDSYDARFSSVLGGEEYDDLLIALKFYNEFQETIGIAIQEYLRDSNLESVTVLEAGPGTGITTLEILKSDPRIKVVSVDNEPKMLKATEQKFDQIEEFKDRVEFIYSDILEYLLSCKDDTFDIFASVYTLHNFTSEFRRQVLQEIARVLKPDGLFVNGDKYAREESLHKQDIEGELRSYDNFDEATTEAEKSGDMDRAQHLKDIKEEWIKHTYEDDENKITMKEQEDIFTDLGFSDISWGKRFDLVTTVTAIKN